MNLLNKPHVLMELAFLGDCIHVLTEVTSHLKDGQVFKTLDFGHCGFKFQGSEAARFKIQVSGQQSCGVQEPCELNRFRIILFLRTQLSFEHN